MSAAPDADQLQLAATVRAVLARHSDPGAVRRAVTQPNGYDETLWKLLCEQVGVAALAMQDPEIATRELERCVKELGFRGALVNGFSQVGKPDTAVYYDLPQYRPFWEQMNKLGKPIWIHPARGAETPDYPLV